MKKINSLFAILSISILSVSCTGSGDTGKRLATLESANANLTLKVSIAEWKLSGLELRLNALENNEATLDPTEKGFGIVKTNNGHLLVSCEDLVPYGDGQKISLRVGNPYNMSFNGFTVSARYGPRCPDMPNLSDSTALKQWSSSYSIWEKSLRKKELSFTEVLAPGRWNRISMVLAPAKAEDVGFIGVKISTNQVSLGR